MAGRADPLSLLAALALALAIGVANSGCGTSDSPSGCPPCPLGSTCVERFDGTCHTAGAICVATTESCAVNTCSAACEAALCPSPYQCQNRAPCGGETTGAFLCYGP